MLQIQKKMHLGDGLRFTLNVRRSYGVALWPTAKPDVHLPRNVAMQTTTAVTVCLKCVFLVHVSQRPVDQPLLSTE